MCHGLKCLSVQQRTLQRDYHQSRRAGANSLNFAILIAIPAILTALSHLLLNILAHQGDSQWSRDHTNNPTMRLLHTSKLSFIIVCQWNSESLASLVFGRPICWSWACYFSEIFLAKCWDTPMLFGDRMRSDSVTSSSGTFLQNTKWRHRLVLFPYLNIWCILSSLKSSYYDCLSIKCCIFGVASVLLIRKWRLLVAVLIGDPRQRVWELSG